MGKSNDGGQAFPVVSPTRDFAPVPGMTLRDYFAATAANGALSANVRLEIDEIASYAYALADAMLRERAAQGGEGGGDE